MNNNVRYTYVYGDMFGKLYKLQLVWASNMLHMECVPAVR